MTSTRRALDSGGVLIGLVDAACRQVGARRRGRPADGGHGRPVDDAVAVHRRIRVGAQVAGSGPELVLVGGVGSQHTRVQGTETVHPHRPPAEPGARGEAHPGHLVERGTLFVGEVERAGVAAGIVGVGDVVEDVAQDALGVHPHTEDVRHGHRAADHVRNEPVPDARGVLGGADRTEPAAASAVEVPVGAVLAVEGCCHETGERRGGRIGTVRADARIHSGERIRCIRAAAVGLHEVAPAGQREGDLVLFARCVRREVLALRDRGDMLDEAALIAVGLRKVEREPGVRPDESAVHIPVRHGLVPPFVDVEVRSLEVCGVQLPGEIGERVGCGGHRWTFLLIAGRSGASRNGRSAYFTPLSGMTATAASRTRTKAAIHTPRYAPVTATTTPASAGPSA